MPALWLIALAWFSLGLALLCTALIFGDIYARGYRQKMGIMEAVWPVTVLYFGPLGLWAYARWGRPQTSKWQAVHGTPSRKSFAATVSVDVSHCGAGCTLGDIIGGWIIFAGGFAIAGSALWPEHIADYVLALCSAFSPAIRSTSGCLRRASRNRCNAVLQPSTAGACRPRVGRATLVGHHIQGVLSAA